MKEWVVTGTVSMGDSMTHDPENRRDVLSGLEKSSPALIIMHYAGSLYHVLLILVLLKQALVGLS